MDPTQLADMLGWIGNLGFIVGALALAKRKAIWAQSLNIFGNLLYIFYAWLLHTPSLVVLSIVLIGINVCGIVSWMRKPKDD